MRKFNPEILANQRHFYSGPVAKALFDLYDKKQPTDRVSAVALAVAEELNPSSASKAYSIWFADPDRSKS